MSFFASRISPCTIWPTAVVFRLAGQASNCVWASGSLPASMRLRTLATRSPSTGFLASRFSSTLKVGA